MMKTVDAILEQKSVRITPMRQLLLKHFLQKGAVFGLNELEEDFPKSDRITIYRTLKTFEEKGIIHSIPNGVSEVKYALCKEHCEELHHVDRHPHFHCLICGSVECLESIILPPTTLPEGYTAQETRMTIKGTCKKCQD
ncbi:MAG: transcriptional repressor [Bacteroidia bacterium]|nr:transcriptional repressor [Bacteroidia bacterium]